MRFKSKLFIYKYDTFLINNVITYQNGEISIDVNFDYEHETIWLTQEQIANLFEVDRTRITRHIQNILADGELDNRTCAENAHVQMEGKRQIKRTINVNFDYDYETI